MEITQTTQTFALEDGTTLQILTNGATSSSRASVDLKLSGGPLTEGAPLAHWGAIKRGSSGWKLPGVLPEGTRRYKNRALQTPFSKSGDGALTLRIELASTDYTAVEFTLKDEASGLWFNLDGTNFCADIPPPSAAAVAPEDIVVPEELVRVQAYLRWERNGKQNYSPEVEKVEYELARRELQDEVASGASIHVLEARLLGGGGGSSTESAAPVEEAKKEKKREKKEEKREEFVVPDDLVAVQSYLLWERNGKPNYSQEQQLSQYEAARQSLEEELRAGLSLADLKERLTGGGGGGSSNGNATATEPRKVVSPTPEPERRSRGGSVSRKGRNPDDMINKFDASSKVTSPTGEADKKKKDKKVVEASALELAAQVFEGARPDTTIAKKWLNAGGSKLLILVEMGDEMVVHMASDYPNPLFLRWGLSRSKRDSWQSPPDALCSVELENACESEFEPGFGGQEGLQSLTLTLGGLELEYPGLPFVLRSGDVWIKDASDMDFFVSLRPSDLKPAHEADTGVGTDKFLLDMIADSEYDAERSLMHRFNIGTNILSQAVTRGELGLAAVFIWFRFMATRQLGWNRNYNVKPREISAAQDGFTSLLESTFRSSPAPPLRELIRLVMMTVGRGGQGDVGQRIRDEILVIQRANDCMGGMMEQWHQKLHNNTSPDDVVICQALLDYLRAGLDVDVYWQTMNANGVTKERLRSYDKAITSEPSFRPEQRERLIHDLGNYMKSLKAVHSGADLESAVASCMGYTQGAKADFMTNIEIHPIQGLSSDLPHLLQFALEHIEDWHILGLVEALVESRQELRPSLLNSDQSRLKDILFLDLALDSALRTAVERGSERVESTQDLLFLVSMVVENLALSVDDNRELVYCLKDWQRIRGWHSSSLPNWPLAAKAVLERTRLFLGSHAERISTLLQPSAQYLGRKLGVDGWAIDIFSEEVIRSGSAASLSLLLNRLDPMLRAAGDMGSWQLISPIEAVGIVEVVSDLKAVQEKVYPVPTILVSAKVEGEEEIPDGVVAVVTPDMPDVLAHVSVRARNGKVCFATCFDPALLDQLRSLQGKRLLLKPTRDDLEWREVGADEAVATGNAGGSTDPPPGLSIAIKEFAGKFAITSDEFNPDLVGAKSRNIAGLRGRLPSWIKLPVSLALPFGSFDATLKDPSNESLASEISRLHAELDTGDFSKLQGIRRVVRKLNPPAALVSELEAAMRKSGVPWPGEEGEERWQQAWAAIRRVWASKWNERAFVSMRKARLPFPNLSMAVLVQEVVQADYAFVIHTENPVTLDSTEIYAEVVKGLGETLVGAYEGRALSFSAKKGDCSNPKLLGFPSKRVGLFICPSLIFRSDSNGEDLEGYAGAGLYDSVPMDKEEKLSVDYSSDPLVTDLAFQKDILSKIAAAGEEIEKALGSAQDVEGVIKNGELYVVQTRPQM